MTTMLARSAEQRFSRPAKPPPEQSEESRPPAPVKCRPADEKAREYAVTSKGLTKCFGRRTVVDALDLAIPKGVVSGFVGPNGAGKTTTIRMLLGLIAPVTGSATVLGHHIGDGASYLPRVGALIEGPTFYPTLSGQANLLVLARLAGIPEGRIPDVLGRVGLTERSGDKFRSYSLGMKQRLGIAAALLPEPELLILDEPTNGLDPAGIAEMRRLLAAFASEGMTVLVSSHLLAEIEQACDHLVIIREGRLVFQGSVEELVRRHQAELRARPESAGDSGRLVSLVRQGGFSARIDDGLPPTIHITAGAISPADLNRLATDAGITLSHLSYCRPSLEEIFFELTGCGVDEGASQMNIASRPARAEMSC
jgi:ABC-2 type transport system ATP-binding protein